MCTRVPPPPPLSLALVPGCSDRDPGPGLMNGGLPIHLLDILDEGLEDGALGILHSRTLPNSSSLSFSFNPP